MIRNLRTYRLKSFCDRALLVARYGLSIAHAYIFKEPPIVLFVTSIIVTMVFLCIAQLGWLRFQFRWQIAAFLGLGYFLMGVYALVVRFQKQRRKINE